MPISTIGQNGLNAPITLTSPVINTVTSASATALTLQSAGTTAITVDTSQNVGIGTASPLQKLQVESVIAIKGSSFPSLKYYNGSSVNVAEIYYGAGGGNDMVIANYQSGPMQFSTNATERMRIDSEGDLCVGTNATNSNERVRIKNGNDTRAIAFQSASAAECGYIYINGGGTTTTYATSSDYRLKENIVPMTGALAKVVALKPVTYKWKVNGFNGQGFIAHELQEVVPDCVIGTKDQINEDGNPVYQGIDTSFLVATLTAAIQELKTIVDAQAAEIAEFKAKVA